MPGSVSFAVLAANRWLLAVSLSTVAVLLGCGRARRVARERSGSRARDLPVATTRPDADASADSRRGARRRAGALMALGPVLGFLVFPSTGELALVVAGGAAALAVVGMLVERSRSANLVAFLATAAAAAVAVAAGARLGPTGSGGVDAVGAFLLVVAVTKSLDGLGNVDSLTAGMGLVAALPLFGIAAFAHQDSLASVLAGLAAACFAFLAFNTRPASLFAGRGGRLAVGYAVSVGALAVTPVAGGGRDLLTPLVVTAVFLLDACIVTVYRLRRRRSLLEHRGDHLTHRFGGIGWSSSEAVGFLVAVQVVLGVTALFTARAVLSVWLGLAVTLVVLLVVGIEAGRGRLEREPATGFSPWIRVLIGVVVVGLVASVGVLAARAYDSYDLMKQGREAATRGLSQARDGDTLSARVSFAQAAHAFAHARDQLDSPTTAATRAVPILASNVNAARALAHVGADLADAGESVSVAVDPKALEIVDGRLPIPEVRKVTPDLQRAAAVLSSSRARLDAVRADPYLVAPVRDAVDKVYTQLARADREAQRASAAAQLAPAIFGGDGPRTYLLVVQNNAESRATGGFIGSYALITAVDGKLHVGDILRTATWNDATRAQPKVTVDAPADYVARYAQYQPGTTLQNVNLSPDFPSVADALMSLAPQAGQPHVDGVLAVDPVGLSALLQLTGPVTVEGWPTPIDSGNVVNVTLRDAYAAFAQTPERADFLGDVAHAAVDQATKGDLGRPANIAKVLGQAAHSGHLILAFARPGEQRLADQLDVALRMDPVHSDAIAVTSSNAAGNKVDYYLDRSVDYRVVLHPDDALDAARASGTLAVQLANNAPASGLPEGVLGPFDARFVAGENRAFLSMYTPLDIQTAAVDGKRTAVSPARERGRNVYSRFADVMSKTTETDTLHLAGRVALHDGWYDVEVRQQPTLNPDHVHVSVDVPVGWKIDRAPGMARPFARRADVSTSLMRTTTYRVHVVRDPGGWNLWDRLEAGR